jgi:hypothetical protein
VDGGELQSAVFWSSVDKGLQSNSLVQQGGQTVWLKLVDCVVELCGHLVWSRLCGQQTSWPVVKRWSNIEITAARSNCEVHELRSNSEVKELRQCFFRPHAERRDTEEQGECKVK